MANHFMMTNEFTMKCNARQCQPKYHPRCRYYHDFPSSNYIDILQGNEREYEIGPRNDEAYCRRLVESDLLEECGGVIHQSVEAAQLLESLHATTNNCDTNRRSNQFFFPKRLVHDLLRARRLIGTRRRDFNRCKKVVEFVTSMLCCTATRRALTYVTNSCQVFRK